jgi:hypothetical protein
VARAGAAATAVSPEEYAREERDAEERICSIRHEALDKSICELKRACELRWAQEEKAMLARWGSLAERFTANDDRIRDDKVVADRAVERAEVLATDRAKQQNEWRDTVNDVIGSRLSRSEYVTQHNSLVEKIDGLATRLDRHEARGIGASSTWVWLFVGLAGAISVITLIIDMAFRH